MIQFCIRNPVKVSVGVIIVALFGGIALWQIPMQLTPEVNTPTISVSVRWPGASPYEVEHEIVQPLEEQLKDIKGLTRMTSASSYSNGSVTLEFPVGTEITKAMLELNSRLNQHREFPEDAYEPVISSANLTDRPVCWFVLSPQVPSDDDLAKFVQRHPHLAEVCQPLIEAHKWDLRLYRLNALATEHPELRTLLPVSDVRNMRRFVEEHIEGRFDRVRGVANAFLLGGFEEEMQVIVDPERLAARQLTMDDLRQALRLRNKDSSGGEIWDGKRRYVVRTLGQFESAEQIQQTIIAQQDDLTTRIEDVAEVKLGHKRPTGSYTRGGSELIGIGIFAETGANVLEIVDEIRNVTEELNEGMLAQRHVRLSEVWSDADYIDSAVSLVNQNIVIGGALTFLVLLAFLRSARSTVVIAIAVPASIVGTFLILRLLGRSLNVVSLAGLAFAVGMIVDNSVVVLENIFRYYQRGRDRDEAALFGTREVWGAVLASTLTTLAVFLPVLFTQEEAGQLFRDIALAISAAVGLSLIIAVTVIPAAASRLLAREPHNDGEQSTIQTESAKNPVDRLAAFLVSGITGTNRWLLGGTVRRLAVVLAFIGGSMAVSYLLFPQIEYLPDGNKARVQCRLYPPPGYNPGESSDIARDAFLDLAHYWEVKPDSPEAEQLDAPPLKDLLTLVLPGHVMIQIQTEDKSRIREWLPKLRAMGDTVPGMRGTAFQLSLFPGSSRKIDVELTGPDVESVVDLAGRVQDRIQEAVPESNTNVVPGLVASNPEMHVLPHWDRAAELGLNVSQLGYSVDALVDGAYAAEYSIGGEKIDLRIIGKESYTSRTEDLGSRTIATEDGRLVPLSSLAEFKMSSGPPSIHHIERRRAIKIEVRPPDGMSLGETMEVLEKEVVRPMRQGGELTDGLNVNLGGTADRLLEAWQAMQFNLLLALAVTYLLMAGLFESWLYPLAIILTVPLAAVGGVACLWLTNLFTDQPLDIITMLGFVILIGTAVNNAILIVHQSINHMREDQMRPQDAVVESVQNRIRPIFMTTGTTVLGLFPLVVMPGTGSELYRGLGSVVLGGLIVSTLLTLFLVPSFFSLVMDVRERFHRRAKPEEESAMATADVPVDMDVPA